ncbi:hypothetical protein ACET3Z_025422 [Daucus carota]
MDSPQDATRAAKRKRFQEMKNNVMDEIYSLVISSDAFVTEIQTTTEEFGLIFQNMQKRQMDLAKQAVLINEKYVYIADIVEEKKKPKVGETSSSFQTLPISYSKSFDRFLEDSELSLQKHTENIKKALEDVNNKFNESVKTWSKNFEELKERANILANSGTRHRMEVDKFRSVVYGFIPGIDSSDSDFSD